VTEAEWPADMTLPKSPARRRRFQRRARPFIGRASQLPFRNFRCFKVLRESIDIGPGTARVLHYP
jgi:hypothetical protein